MSVFKIYFRWLIGGMLLLVVACSRTKKEEPECEPAPVQENAKAKTSEASKKPDQKVDNPNGDWCRACVVGPHGFMSCQRVDGQGAESRQSLRNRARLAACNDSGFKEENCPSENLMALVCRGDKKPEKADNMQTAKKVLKALKKSGPLVLSADGKIDDQKGAESGAATKTPKKAETKPAPPQEGTAQ